MINDLILYKYADFEVGTDLILKKKSIKLTNPLNFNDPFDCDEDLISLSVTDSFIEDFVNRKLPKNRTERKKVISEIKKNRKAFWETFNQCLKDQKNKYRISCFSKSDDCILLWSHYADKHLGICIGFDFSKNFKLINSDMSFTEVKYSEEFQPLRYDLNYLEAFKSWLTIKSNMWSYENEVRLINATRKDYVTFSPSIVKEIIFGLGVDKFQINECMIELTANGYEHVHFFKMIKSNTSFCLIKERIQF